MERWQGFASIDFYTKMASYFFQSDWISKIQGIPKLILFLDFDGTLVPIKRNPDECYLPEEIKKELENLVLSSRLCIAIFSGRSLSDIKKRVGIRGIYYGGNHGIEILGPGIEFLHPDARRAKPILKYIKRRLYGRLRGIDGVLIEDKRYSLTIHYRNVLNENMPLLVRLFNITVCDIAKKHGLDILRGKRVFEILPSLSWNKGKAALWLLSRLNKGIFPVYIGDDETDEKAFRVLKEKGITVCVGRKEKTFAHYYIKNQKEILKFLRIFN